MKNRKRKNEAEKPGVVSGSSVMENIVTDPFGMYTGITVDPDERPIQDADDL